LNKLGSYNNNFLGTIPIERNDAQRYLCLFLFVSVRVTAPYDFGILGHEWAVLVVALKSIVVILEIWLI